MHPSFRVAATGLAAVLLGACFDFGSTTAGGPLEDSGLGTPPVTDAGLDATILDGSPTPFDGTAPPGDGGVDTGTDATPAPPGADAGRSYCATITPPVSGIFFCDDFDEAPLPGAWTSYKETGGLIGDTDAGAFSPPNSVDETTDALTFDEAVDVSLRESPLRVPSLPTRLLFSFAIEPLRIDATQGAAIVLGAVDFLDAAGNRFSVELAINVQNSAAALVLAEQSGFTDGGDPYVPHPLPPSQPLPLDTWTNVVIAIDWTASGTTASVSINGAEVLGSTALTMTVQPASLQIGIGTSYVSEYQNQASPIWELRYDDVLFTAQ